MEEIVPGISHWTVMHERIHRPVSSYYIHPSKTLVDPMVPPEGVEWFEKNGPPERIVLTNRHHWRHSARFVEAFGCPVLCHEAGLHEFTDGRRVEPFAFGDSLATDVTALELDAICPEETALYVEVADGALSFADGVVAMRGGKLAFVPDWLIGKDPHPVKRAIRQAVRPMLDLDFDNLLFAHGQPIVGGGKQRLRRFADEAGA